jgi:hypothetical protein
MEVFTFLCKECGKPFSVTAHSYHYALRILAHWDTCPVGTHACLISMLECSTDVPKLSLVPALDTTTEMQ